MARSGNKWPEGAIRRLGTREGGTEVLLSLRERCFARSFFLVPASLGLPCRRRLLCRLGSRDNILPRRDVGHLGQVRDLAPGGVGDVDAGMIEQQSGGAIQFDPRLLVVCLGGD